ncbi:hypothetical protein DXG03_002143 [Asterophora parasitica]|uniref:Uncharacterized protein n=1 Tax=Asterophora parasitica TaxID=117018 RepID=A0A9P7KB58_9AGAR|nr:hypothetical protein DXG03_002143 [Asterophora parasitica]
MVLSWIEINRLCDKLEFYKYELRPENMKCRMNLDCSDPQKDLAEQRVKRTLEVTNKIDALLSRYPIMKEYWTEMKDMPLKPDTLSHLRWPQIKDFESKGWIVIDWKKYNATWTPKGMLALHNGLSRHYKVVRNAERGNAAAPPAYVSSAAPPVASSSPKAARRCKKSHSKSGTLDFTWAL